MKELLEAAVSAGASATAGDTSAYRGAERMCHGSSFQVNQYLSSCSVEDAGDRMVPVLKTRMIRLSGKRVTRVT